MGITGRFLGLENRRNTRIFHAILDTLDQHTTLPNLPMVREAYALATEVHAKQRRKKTGDAYIIHPLSVALEAAEHRMDDVSVAAAILHDTVEDADESFCLTVDVLGERFGSDVAKIVDGLTKLRREGGGADAKLQTLNHLLTSTVTEDLRTIVIKIFDRVDNIKSVDCFRPDKQRRIATETLQFYVPIASRLGFFKEARVMEDHVMQVLQPDVYKTVSRWLGPNEKRIGRRVDRIVKDVRTTLKEMDIRCSSIFYHKGVYTIFEAMENDGLPLSRLDDGCNFNLCLIVDDVDACFRTLNLVHRKFVHLPARFRDFINNPKVNGYQSLHTLCTGPGIPKIQVLIRTEEMHTANHIGVISQLRSGKVEDTSFLDELVDSFQSIGSGRLFDLAQRVHFPEIDLFTPAGQKIKLPEGATALDFAYQIHTEVGDQARAAEIDGHTRPLKTVLHSGNRVRILTDKATAPTVQRLGWVTTTRATIALRRSLQRIERDLCSSEVDRFLTFCRRRLGIALREDTPAFYELLKLMEFDDALEFGAEFHAGRLDYDHVIQFLAQVIPPEQVRTLVKVLGREDIMSDEQVSDTLELDDEDSIRTTVGEVVGEYTQAIDPSHMPLAIEGLRYPIRVRLAGCCRPQFGDDIVAHTARRRGATIHRRTCRAIRQLVEFWPVQMARASWTGPPRMETVRYDILGSDRRGLLLAISAVLSEIKVDAQSIKLMAEDGGIARGYANLELSALTDREEVAQRLEAIPGITAVRVRGSA